MNLLSASLELLYADGQTDMAKLIVSSFVVNALKEFIYDDVAFCNIRKSWV
jgi:hypothetical protein